MLPILPWMPATALVLGMNAKEAQQSAITITQKTEAMAKAMRGKNQLSRWDPIEIKFEEDGQQIDFTSTCMLDHFSFKTNFEITNEIHLREDGIIAFSVTETMVVSIDTYRNKTSSERPAETQCSSIGKLASIIPQSIAANLAGKTLREIIDFPPAFDAVLGPMQIVHMSGRRLFLDNRAFEEEATELHKKFQGTIPAF